MPSPINMSKLAVLLSELPVIKNYLVESIKLLQKITTLM